jgi:ribonuclease G
LPFNWFRRKQERAQEAVPAEPAAPVSIPVAESPAEAGPTTTTKPRRKRGSRGGRGRKRPAGAAATAAEAEQPAATPKAKPKAKPKPKPQAERKPARAESQGRQRRAASTRRRPPQRRPPLPAAKRELLVSVGVSEQRVAVVEDDRVAEVYLERPERRSIAGNIYKGVVDNVLPGMEAAFVEIGLEKNGFLYVDEIVGPELEGKRHGRRIQDLISRGEELLVQAVKDPMKTKGARLTTEISLPGRFVVYVPYGEGLGVSRRLEDDERVRLRDIVKALKVKKGGVIVRTAAEGASAEDVELDLVFLQRLWKTIEARAKQAKAPALVYQEAELPLRVVRDLFTDDFERAYVDHERTLKRVVGYLKKTSPHLVDRVQRYRDKEPLFEHFGVEDEIRSTISRRVDLPSGGYLVFDYAEAFTVIDVNTGRFVGSRSKTSGARLEDTITKNNLEAVKEVVRQLRLRDIGGIIVIDFIDMANPKNRELVEEALKTELERDRTKTYVVEISPLGLVEMTRQNVTDGPREILTKKCPTCGGDGIVVSEASAAVEAERRLRSLAAGAPRTQAFEVELNARVAAILIGAGASRLLEIEEQTKRRFLLVGKPDVHVDHFLVLRQGKLATLQGEPPIAEGKELDVKLVEVGLYDASSAMGSANGVTICVGNAAALVGKKVKVRVARVLDGVAYASIVSGTRVEEPITAEAEAEKPTRAPRARKAADEPAAEAEEAADEDDEVAEELPEPQAEAEAEEPVEGEAEPAGEGAEEAPKPKKRTRRGSRGGRGRKKKPAVAAAEPSEAPQEEAAKDAAGPKIHLPPPDLGREPTAEAEPEPSVRESGPGEAASGEPGGSPAEAATAEDGAAPKPRKRTRRGSRGGRNRRRKTPAAASAEATEPTPAE